MALSANANPVPRPDPQIPYASFYFKAEGADEFYRGAVACESAGKAVVDNADADNSIGVVLDRVTATAADDPVLIAVTGIWWFAAADLVDASLWALATALPTSDVPADLTIYAGGDPGALGLLVHVDATAVSGWVDFSHRVVPTNA